MADLFTLQHALAKIQPALTVDTSAYASGDLISKAGTVLSITSAMPADQRGRAGIIQSIGLVDQAKQSAAIDVVFFNANPTATTFTDNAAFDIDDSDMAKIIGYASITSYASFNDNSFGFVGNLAMEFALNGSTTLYAALVSRGAPTYAAATDLVLTVGILRI
jgi:hypothetical protein